MAEQKPPQATLNPHIREYCKHLQPTVKGSWLAKPEIPSANEILRVAEIYEPPDGGSTTSDQVYLKPNKIKGKWKSKEDYLSAHYELLREDVLGPFCDAVEHFRDGTGKENETFCAYEKVHIKGFVFATQGVATRVTFSFKRAGKKIIWEQSKRLMTGSLVALTPVGDMFKTTCLIAVVAARPLDGIKQVPPEIDLFFARPKESEIDPQKEWTMVEAKTGYFEASRHVLVGLQKLMKESFPLSEHLVRLRPKIEPPRYLAENPVLDLSPALARCSEEGSTLRFNALGDWPETSSDILDKSQWSALKQILTKSLAIVQGPPGTGKTHVSVIAIRILLDNMNPSDPPIVVAAQTNHALDQLLLLISKFESNFIRLGGQTSDTGMIKNRTLYEVRKANPSERDPPGCARSHAFMKQKRLVKNFTDLLMTFQNHEEPLPATFFRDLGLVTDEQLRSLDNASQKWTGLGGPDASTSPMTLWLGSDALKPFKVVYTDDNFGFDDIEEEDLEFEQLKEHEAEQGLGDDTDFETLKGKWLPVVDLFTGPSSVLLTDKFLTTQLSQSDLWKIPKQARAGVYSYLQRKAKEIVRTHFRELAVQFSQAVREHKIGKMERDAPILSSAKLIGMTTTGLSKYRPLIASLKPRILLIEEAAEIVEGPVAVGCFESLQHMILVGDHKQLQGHCTMQELEGDPFYLDISMFERLVGNSLEFKTLTKQRRMIPEISRLLSPIYQDALENHEVVKQREPIPGMGGVNSFFFCHSWPETTDSYSSKVNDHEADMIVAFFLHLYHNGIRADQITVLTFYNGQRKRILTKLRKQKQFIGIYFKVVTVDSYQGEENEVVILSLVRSNPRGNIGFLSIENRVCVALSRAKRGFYIFGNAEKLCITNRLWWEVLKIMAERPRRVGFALPLTCENHGRKVWVKNSSEFDLLCGGCERRCPENMKCGHQCPLNCHTFPHELVYCSQQCRQIVPCDRKHRCVLQCSVLPCSCPCFEKGGPRVVVSDTEKEDDDEEGESLLSPQVVRNHPTASQTQNSPAAKGSPVQISLPVRQRKTQTWKAYADGGHVEHDAQLYEKAERTSEVKEEDALSRAASRMDGVRGGKPTPATDVTPMRAKKKKKAELLIDFLA